MIRSSLALLAAALLAAPLAARPVDDAARSGILLLGNGADPATLDPHLATGVPENRVISALIEGLIAYHPTDQSLPAPGVAESWEPSADYRVWTFRLRSDARWSNGDPVRASDFVYSAQRILSPEFGAQYANMLYVLAGAEGFHRQTDPALPEAERVTDFGQVGVRARDERTLEYTLVGPAPFFPSMLTHYSWFPVHPPTIEKFGGMTKRFSDWTRPENFVGNGPYVLTEWSINQVIRATRSPTYWDGGTVKIEEIRFFPIENSNTEEQSFLNGQLHVTNVVPPDRIQWWRKNQPASLRLEPYLGTYFYRFNTQRKPLDDVRVRRALTLAIDQQLIVDRITQGGEAPAYGFIPEGMLGYQPPVVIEYDPDLARQLLAEAGFPDGRGFPRLELMFNTLEAHRRIAEAVQQMWREKLGIEITIVNNEWKVYLDRQRTMQYDISRSGWIGDYMDPVTMLKLWQTNDGNNNTGWSSPEYDRLLRASWQIADPKERYATLRQAEEVLLAELPIAPLYWYTTKRLVDPRVRGWNPLLLDNRPYKHLSFAP